MLARVHVGHSGTAAKLSILDYNDRTMQPNVLKLFRNSVAYDGSPQVRYYQRTASRMCV